MMKRVHLAALACFFVAVLFNVMSWTPGYGVLVVLGLVLEAAAWLLLWMSRVAR